MTSLCLQGTAVTHLYRQVTSLLNSALPTTGLRDLGRAIRAVSWPRDAKHRTWPVNAGVGPSDETERLLCDVTPDIIIIIQKQNKLHGLSPRANYTDRATAACRRNDCQLVRIEGATWSA
jgi:hypothetical protein